MFMRIFFFALVTLGLSACGSHVKSNVQTFHSLGAGFAPNETVAIIAGDESKQGSLEFKVYAQKLAAHLQALGLQTVGVTDDPDYAVVFNYGIDDGQVVTSTYSIPQWGQTGVSSSQTTGTVTSYGGMGTYSGTTTYTPTYGITGYTTGTSTSMSYTRAAIINFFRVKGITDGDYPPVVEMTVTSSGSCGNVAGVIDEMLLAAFQDFPGPGGQSRTIEIPSDGNC